MSFSRLGYNKDWPSSTKKLCFLSLSRSPSLWERPPVMLNLKGHPMWSSPCGKEPSSAHSHMSEPGSTLYLSPTFRWLQLWPATHTQPRERPWARTTQPESGSCFLFADPQKLQDNVCFEMLNLGGYLLYNKRQVTHAWNSLLYYHHNPKRY